jgi:hypothetical protein
VVTAPAVRSTVDGAHTAAGSVITTVAKSRPMVVLAVVVIPFASFIKTVYVSPFNVGVTVGAWTVVALNTVDGLVEADHEYVNGTSVAVGLAVSVTLLPAQIVTPPPAIKTDGSAAVIPVKTEVWPSVRVTELAVNVAAPKTVGNFTQGFED